MTDQAPVVIAIAIGKPELADRLSALLADVPGVRLAAPGEPADAALVIPDEPEPGPDVASNAARTRRAGAHRRGSVEQGDRAAPRDLGSHGEVSHRLAARSNSTRRVGQKPWRKARGSARSAFRHPARIGLAIGGGTDA